MNTNQAEQEDNFRLAKAAEFLKQSRNAEAEARRVLAAAIEQTGRAKEKYEELFDECEKRAVSRRKSGEIVNNPGY